MLTYEENALLKLKSWQRKMERRPSITSHITSGVQRKINSLIPEKAHEIITGTIKNMVKAVLTGSEYMTKQPLPLVSLEERERLVMQKIDFYKKTAAASGAGTGAGGFIIGLADFPILMSLKIKFLYDAASIYGFDVKDYRERLFILYVFQLAFSSQERQFEIYHNMLNWDSHVKILPSNLNDFDWRTFQQEYRDYIDIAKMLQMLPGIGAVVGAYANYKLMDKLGETAMNAYRMRILNK